MLTTGTTFGRYKVLAKLGRGGMSIVYRALDTQMQRDVALKILAGPYAQDLSFRQRFKQEAMTVIKLNHYAIVQIFDYGEHLGQPYIAMQLMTGGTLEDRLRTQPLSLQEATSILSRVCEALHHAHMNDIIHRDLKPGNVFFDGGHTAYLGDFGIARDTNTAKTTQLLGTPAYTSPEQLRNERLSHQTDIYQLGTMFFEMVTGKPPYSGDSAAVIQGHLLGPVPSILAINPNLPQECETIIRRTMAKRKEERYPSVTEFLAALQTLNRNLTSAPIQTLARTQPVVYQSPISQRTQVLTTIVLNKLKAMDNSQLAMLSIGSALSLGLLTALIGNTVRHASPFLWELFGSLYLTAGALAYQISRRKIAPLAVHFVCSLLVLLVTYPALFGKLEGLLIASLLSGAVLNYTVVETNIPRPYKYIAAIAAAQVTTALILSVSGSLTISLLAIIGSALVGYAVHFLTEVVDGVQRASVLTRP
jgi:serine/threonine protein kinase